MSGKVEREYEVARKETDSRRLESMHSCPVRLLYDNAIELDEWLFYTDDLPSQAREVMDSMLKLLDYTNERKMVIDVRDYDSLVKYIEYLENVADELSVAVMKGMKPKGSTIAFNRPSSAVALGTFEE